MGLCAHIAFDVRLLPSDLRISRHFPGEMGGVIVDVTRSLSQPTSSDDCDVLLLAIFR